MVLNMHEALFIKKKQSTSRKSTPITIWRHFGDRWMEYRDSIDVMHSHEQARKQYYYEFDNRPRNNNCTSYYDI